MVEQDSRKWLQDDFIWNTFLRLGWRIQLQQSKNWFKINITFHSHQFSRKTIFDRLSLFHFTTPRRFNSQCTLIVSTSFLERLKAVYLTRRVPFNAVNSSLFSFIWHSWMQILSFVMQTAMLYNTSFISTLPHSIFKDCFHPVSLFSFSLPPVRHYLYGISSIRFAKCTRIIQRRYLFL